MNVPADGLRQKERLRWMDEMKDRYLFKAKTCNGEWVVGYLYRLSENNPPFIMLRKYGESYEVDEHTVCQCTGLRDKNGKLIWENDIVFVTDDNGCSGQIDTGVGEIDFLEGLWYISGHVQNSLYDIDKCFQLEVIGNIFDNPDLLKMEV